MSIQGLPFEVTVVGCYNLEDKEWISKQDPYVCVEYGSAKYRTRTCTGLKELNVVVWNSNTIVADDHIGTGRVQLHKVLSQGFDDCTWPLQSKYGRHAGEVRLILHYSNAKAPQPQKSKCKTKSIEAYVPSAPFSQVSPYGYPPAPSAAPYPTMSYAAPSHYKSCPTAAPAAVGYPHQAPLAPYPPQAYPPPPPQASIYYPPAPTGIYPSPPY
ncbi:hypothetical protein ERO13_A06G021250v2 [Gossypium hirsutum]|uniref:C2 domain-containing protein n=3 Tax=Gossypium TaxID=3633 RepID=A0A2P5WG77_GOSBA|nr:hypothetical protein ES319_A06G023400v1 [Gossypium barbadense]KAG4193891.1 hypothetical protein ERO13_A06G021250v2 [Gossypium hirsutum]PPR90107.1 hypothetical protein GOBAR_AA30570 [Gossypium barbadense]TYI21237.1 hypothetical protein ES332_A06G023700v1 [Gossypium tomentosum]TYJ28769.1 hypothetical protein E1A91_A06G022700v1 [Gossypium mustelinum]